MSVRPKLRFEVFTRDGFRCRYCGRTPDRDDIKLQADHLHPKSKGGLDELSNLVTACWDCNIGKLDRVLRPVPKRAYRPRTPSIAPRVDEPPEFEVGAHCSTPLKIAAVGVQFGMSNYAQSHRYIAGLRSGTGMPPLRKTDYGWYRYCQLNMEPQRLLAVSLHFAIKGEMP